jgi:tetratricopeptide (TPR) repeat protein
MSGKEDAKVYGDLQKVLKKNPGMLSGLIVEAYIDLYAGRQLEAEQRLQSVLAKSSTDPVALSLLAQLAYARADFISASDLFARLRNTGALTPSLEPESQRALLLAMEKLLQDAKLAAGRNDLSEAERLYREAMKLAPREPALHEQLAEVLAREGKREEVETAALRTEPQTAADLQREAAVAAPADVGRWGNQIERFHEIQAANSLTREQLAALLVKYFPEVGTFAKTQEILADVEQSWAEASIQAVVRVGLLDPMANHTFQPARTVTRGEFAACIARLTRLLGVSADTTPPIRPVDVVPGSPLARELQPVLGFGLMDLDNAGNFNVGASLSGGEAVNIAEKLLRLLQKNTG